jgi:putative membrane protein
MQTPASVAPATRVSRRGPADWLWLAFLVWTAIGFIVLPLNIGERQARVWIANPALLHLAIAFLRQSDAIWILLAASNVYLHIAASEGLATARRWAAIILVASAGFEWIGVRSGFPFGTYRYTDQFGWRLGGVVPAAIPLAWLVILLCGRYLVLAIWPQASRLKVALGVAAVAVLTDLNLEFVAWKVRGYWIWYPGGSGAEVPRWPPLQNYLSWFLLSFALGLLLRPSYELRLNRPSPARPILILALMNLLFACAQLCYWSLHDMR